jgi:HlyD family type I secretion membrane fusion protein
MVFSEIDIVATARGKIIPSFGMQLIQPETVNTVENIYVEEGDRVNEGDLLIDFKKQGLVLEKKQAQQSIHVVLAEIFRLRTIKEFLKNKKKPELDKPDIPLNILITQEYLMNNQIEHFKKQASNLEARIKSKVEQKKSIEKETDKIKALIPYTKKKIQRLTPLVKKGMAFRDELDTYTEKLTEKSENIKIQEAELSRIDAEIKITETEKQKIEASFKQDIATHLSEAETRAAALEIELAKIEEHLKARRLYAPIDGIIHNLKVHTVNGVVQSGEIIMEVIPLNAKLEVEANVLNNDIGFINAGQEIKFKIDSFPFTKYGYIEGTVQKIELASVPHEQLGSVYPATVQLAQNSITANGRKISLIPGMTGTVDIKIGKRKIIEYILAPVLRYKDEAMKEK